MSKAGPDILRTEGPGQPQSSECPDMMQDEVQGRVPDLIVDDFCGGDAVC